jgi:hypothetical protein
MFIHLVVQAVGVVPVAVVVVAVWDRATDKTMPRDQQELEEVLEQPDLTVVPMQELVVQEGRAELVELVELVVHGALRVAQALQATRAVLDIPVLRVIGQVVQAE